MALSWMTQIYAGGAAVNSPPPPPPIVILSMDVLGNNPFTNCALFNGDGTYHADSSCKIYSRERTHRL